jgi:hypothetical protein
MNIQTVANNLRATIAGKEQMLVDLKGRRIPPEVSIHWLKINIAELKRILRDVEQCEPSLPGEGNNSSWITNPDRMGGSFTEDELDPNRGWK